MGIKIIGTGKYLPEMMVANEAFAKFVETSDEWITTRTGIKTRRVETQKMNWEMAACAAADALQDAGLQASDLDMIVVSTTTPDYFTPSMACLTAKAIGAKSPLCLDINGACAGFVNAVDLVKRYLHDGDEYKTALIVSSEMLTKVTDFSDRATCVLFGDGAGAAVVQKSDTTYASVTGSDPTGGKHLFMRGIPPADFFREEQFNPFSDGWTETKDHTIYMNGQEVYKFSTKVMPMCIQQACEKAGMKPSDLDMIFPHQANRRIIETAAKNLKMPIEKFYLNITDHGNMSSACIPICLSEAKQKGLLNPGDKICIVGFGGGLVYAGCVFQW